jgi:hypothetical protein
MKAVRAEVQTELNTLAAAAIKTPNAPGSPPTPQAPSVRVSDIDDLNKAGKIANDFMTGMDRIADVLMLLVMKFGRASTMMRGVFIGNFVGVLLLAINLIALWHMSSVQTDMLAKQEKIQDQQTQILERQGATQRVAGEAKQQAEAAVLKAGNAPEVSIDAKGRYVLKVPDRDSPGETHNIRLPSPR